MLMPPRNTVRPSTISSLRWSRWFKSQPAFAVAGLTRIELQRADAVVAQALEELLRRTERAHAVVDQVHLHALLLLCDQRIRKAPADVVVLEDVRLHVDVVACGRDGREHGAVRVRSVLQQAHAVATDEWRSRHRLLDREVAIEDPRIVSTALESGEDLAAARGRQRSTRTFDLCTAPIAGDAFAWDVGQGAAPREWSNSRTKVCSQASHGYVIIRDGCARFGTLSHIGAVSLGQVPAWESVR